MQGIYNSGNITTGSSTPGVYVTSPMRGLGREAGTPRSVGAQSKSMKTTIPSICCAILAVALPCTIAVAADTATSSSTPTMNSSGSALKRADQNFLEKASMTGMKEVAVSRAALPNLKNPEIRAFAERMVSDHTHGNMEMMALIASKGAMLPDKASKDMKLDAKWSKASDDLDEDYMEMMVADHKKAVELHEEASRSSDSEIAAHAQKMLPTLRDHLAEAQRLEKLVD